MSNAQPVLQKYNIVEKLASGGMAEIFLAARKGNYFQNKFYVIKRVLPTLTDKTEYLIYLKDEAKALSLLQHHNIVGFHDFFYENEEFYLVMEYISGKTLREIFSEFRDKNQTLSVEYLLYIVMEVAAGLEHAHRSYDHILDKSLNLVHRDLNPQNILVSYDGQVKIIDFGISKFDIRDEFTKTGMLKGKFGYMSPEQVEGVEVDARTDVFALGIVLWELLTNKRLFDGEDDFEKFNKVRNYQVASICQHNSVLSKDLDRIVGKALAPKVADRYQSAADFRYDLSLYVAKNFPDFRAEHFKRLIQKIYADEYKKSIEKLRQQFHKTAVEEDEHTRVTRELVLKHTADDTSHGLRRSSRDGNSRKIEVPEAFNTNVHKARLKMFVPTYEPEKEKSVSKDNIIDLKKKKAKVPKHTLLEPERYNVQVKNIKVSAFHAWINSYGPKVKAMVYAGSVVGIFWGLLVTYQHGYIHLLAGSARVLYKTLIAIF